MKILEGQLTIQWCRGNFLNREDLGVISKKPKNFMHSKLYTSPLNGLLGWTKMVVTPKIFVFSNNLSTSLIFVK